MGGPVDLARYIVDVPDYPRPGVVFKDITPLLASATAFDSAVDGLLAPFGDTRVDLVAGIESRGFIFGGAIARARSAGFVPVRKGGKLPRETFRQAYVLEYGGDAVEVHADALAHAPHVLVVDDLAATGGTLCATVDLIARAGGVVVGIAVLIELTFLEPRARLPAGMPLHSVLTY